MWRSSWRRVSSFFLNVSSFFLSMIATYDLLNLIANLVPKLRLLPFDAGRQEKVAPHRTLSDAKSNKYRKRERDRASTGGEAKGHVSKAHFRHYQAPGKDSLLSRKSRLVRGWTERGRGILRKFLLGGLRPLDLELVEQKRRAGYAEPHRLRAVLDRGRGSGGDEIAAQRADVEISEDAAANQFFMRVLRPDAIEEPGFEARPHGFHVESVRQITLPAEVDQFRFETGIGLGVSRLQNKIAGTRQRRSGGGGTTVTIRSGEVANGLASDEIGDELPLFDQRHALRFDAFVVEGVIAEQRLAGNRGKRRVVEHID